MVDFQKPKVVCLFKPETMGVVLAKHYSDEPLSMLPGFARRILARRWRQRDDVFYVEARTEAGEYMGFLFGQTLGEAPWRSLMSDPVWMTPFALFPLLARRFKRRAPRPAEEVGSTSADDHPTLDFPPLPEGILQSEPYLKMDYMEVEPQFRGMRVAHYLYTAMEEQARAAGLGMISSRIAIHNLPSVKALHRAGYMVYLNTPSELRSVKKLGQAADQ